jgi:YggT family protein
MDATTAGTVASFLAPFLTLSILLMICRIPLSWYPNLDVKKLPWSIAVAPTEPLLGPTRKAIPPVGGVDVAPIVWVAVLTFINEILLGPQGILNLLQRKAEL